MMMMMIIIIIIIDDDAGYFVSDMLTKCMKIARALYVYCRETLR